MHVVALRNNPLSVSASSGADALDAEAARELELQWVQQSLDGDARAFRFIVERHHAGLFRLAMRMLGDRAEADDTVQETFARAFKRLEHFDPHYRLSTWLYRIALNICRDHLKSPRRKEKPHGLGRTAVGERADDAVNAEVRLERARRAHLLRTCLDRLSSSYREAIVLKDLEELSYQEMRDLTGAPVTALKIRVVRARAKLRTLLEEEGMS